MQIIDVWTQHPSSRFLADPMFDSLKRWIKDDLEDIPLEMTLAAMDEGNIDLALLTAWYSPKGALISNQDVLEVVQKYPKKFAGVASADLRNPVEAVKSVREYVGEHGFKAVRIIQWLWDLPCTHPYYYPLATACVEMQVPLCFQVGLTGPLCASQVGRPHHIERLALDFPDLKIVCGHIGSPWQAEMIAYATKFPNVYIDTSAYVPRRYPQELVSYMKGHGRHKVMFGSNYPMLQPAACLAQLDQLELDEECRDLFLAGNARRVFRL